MICEELKKPENEYEAASILYKGSERSFARMRQIIGLDEEEVVEVDDDDE